jgi:hypothetical protein
VLLGQKKLPASNSYAWLKDASGGIDNLRRFASSRPRRSRGRARVQALVSLGTTAERRRGYLISLAFRLFVLQYRTYEETQIRQP